MNKKITHDKIAIFLKIHGDGNESKSVSKCCDLSNKSFHINLHISKKISCMQKIIENNFNYDYKLKIKNA